MLMLVILIICILNIYKNVFFNMKKSAKIIAIIWKVLKILCGFTSVIESHHKDDSDVLQEKNKR